ncbi:hepatoma-derived growth factor-related protein 2-like isoform X4 [Mauremys mutica]|uniref:hepatoma-derived growth factor-related protein 2-like isoform X4 n=1 Tax=Mauremys mutica TaxID=74926 RepID=UPI001D15F349|nr:hepatoma-derived growth factor-related protein 2-like isoform X4 [Mauremys mutica]
MRLWLLAGLAAALTLVAVAGADLGDSTEVEDVVGEKEDRLRVRREDKKPRPPPSQPCPGCYSPLSKPGKPARARRQVEKQQQPGRRPRPEHTWRPGVLTSLSKDEDRLRVRREDKKRRPPLSEPCPGCYSPLRKLGEPARARRQVEKQQQPGRRPTWRPGSLSLLRPAKPEVQDSEVRTRREVERYPQLRPGPRSNSPGHSLYNYGYMTALSSPANISLQDNHQQERVKREGQKPQRDRPTRKPTWRPGSGSIIGWSPPKEVKDKLPGPKLPCPSCHGSVATGQEGRSAEGILSPRTRREDERPPVAKRQAKQRARDRLYCAGCYSGITLRSQTPPLREAAEGGSSGD